jgi:two-component system, OmpR family, sensor histidine kinase MtrB
MPAASAMTSRRSGNGSSFRRARTAGRSPWSGRRRLERADPTEGVDDPTKVLLDLAPAAVWEERLAEIVHDLTNPLNTIALETHLLDDKVAAGDSTEIRSAAARISRNVFFLERMVRDLLDSCSTDAGRFEIRRAPTELRALTLRVVDRVVSTRDSGRVWIDASAPLTLSIDELRIERVVANLLQNALKYTPRPGLIGIRLEVTDHHARISVVDAGPGLTVAEAAYVFDKYRRGRSSATHEGSGLGLYVSKQIVEAHGGKLWVSSAEGAGSCFYVELPRT